jgi:hypothetical protein
MWVATACNVHSLQCAAAFCRSVKNAIATKDGFVMMESSCRGSGMEKLAVEKIVKNKTSYIPVQDVGDLSVSYKNKSAETLQHHTTRWGIVVPF